MTDDRHPATTSLIVGRRVPHRVRVENLAADGECLLYHAARDEASALNRTATEIWELCDGQASIDAIAARLGDRYRVDAQALLADVVSAIAALQARGLVQCIDRGPLSP